MLLRRVAAEPPGSRRFGFPVTSLTASVRRAVITVCVRVGTEHTHMHSPTGRLGRLLAGVAVIAATGLIVPSTATAAPSGTTGPLENYLVVFKGSSSPADAAAIVTRAGGTI